MTTLRFIVEIALGVLYSAGAVFNAAYTLRHTRQFYGGFLEGAWHQPARWFLRAAILPNAVPFTVLLILFEAALAILIFVRCDLVPLALLAGSGFCLAAAVVSSPGGTAANIVLAAIQIALAVSR